MCVRRWIWSRIGCNRSRVKNIPDGNKRSSYVFLAIWISLQCNFTGKTLCFSFTLNIVYTETRLNSYFFLYFTNKKAFSFLRNINERVTALTVLTAIFAWSFCCWTKYRYTHTRVQLHWIMNELTCFSDDNRDECHLSHTTRCNWAVKHAVHISKLSDGVVLTCKIGVFSKAQIFIKPLYLPF